MLSKTAIMTINGNAFLLMGCSFFQVQHLKSISALYVQQNVGYTIESGEAE